MKLITLLDEAIYTHTAYVWGNKSSHTRFSPVASCLFLKPTELVVFLTKEAEDQILDDFLSELPESLSVQSVRIPAGSNQIELGEVAQLVNSSVEDGEEVAFDITHGPLSFPLVALLAAIFLRISRNVKLRAILYGARGIDAGTASGQTPMFDLGLMFSWLEWFTATERFIQSSDSTGLAVLLKERRRKLSRSAISEPKTMSDLGNLSKLAGVLKNISDSLHLIRPFQAMSQISDLPDRLHNALPLLQRDGATLSYLPLMENIVDQYQHLALSDPSNPETVENAIMVKRRMINWYAQRELWVEAVTLAREWLVSWLMVRLGIPQITNLTARQRVESVLRAEANDYLNARKRQMAYKSIFLKDIPHLEELLALWLDLVEVRNDINHAGMRQNPGKPRKLTLRIKKCIKVINQMPLNLPIKKKNGNLHGKQVQPLWFDMGISHCSILHRT